jgi:probable HAF family extracellular repeat protein
MTTPHSTTLALALLGLCSLSPGAAIGQTYHMHPAGPAGTESTILALDQSGRCAGTFVSHVGNAHVAYTFDQGAVTIAPTLPADSQSDAMAFAGGGAVVGVSYDLGELSVRSFLSLGGGAPSISLGTFSARGAGPSGDVVGFLTVANSSGICVDHAARLRAGTLTDLLTLQNGTNSYAHAVNSRGQIVGRSDTANDAGTQGALWQDSSPLRVGLGTLGGTFSEAFAINDLGSVVGVSTTAARAFRAVEFRLDAAGFVIARNNLGALPTAGGTEPWSYAFGVNNTGLIVGASNSRGVMWRAGRIIDLNALALPPTGWRIETARAVNESGTIAAQAFGDDGYRHAVLLVPCPADADRSGSVDIDDLFEFLDTWFAGMGACPVTLPTGCPGDLDLDGTVNANDLFVFLDDWFAGMGRACPLQ